MLNPLVIDVETTISNTGNPFDLINELVVIGLKYVNGRSRCIYKWWEHRDSIQNMIDTTHFLILCNAKFDLHWLRRAGFNFENKTIWDIQLGEFILDYQEKPYPSLDDALLKYGAEPKLDVVKNEYWNKGINTDDIPQDTLTEYLIGDLEKTEFVFKKQYEQFKTDKRYTLFKLQCKDLLVLEEMEWNGIKFNTEKAMAKAKKVTLELDAITTKILLWANGVPINLDSNDHLSCLLYGGTVVEEYRVPIGVYKTGAQVGQVRNKVLTKEYILPRIIEPVKGSECAKEGYWKTNEEVIRQLKTNDKGKELLSLIKQQAKLTKLKGTYLIGWTNLISKMNWEHNMIHGTLNQCRVVTGRLSSDSPNLQNADPITKIYCETRYG
jgi:DNA polymerase I-like protein with 3'-5' exonuclease and polymerase domains